MGINLEAAFKQIAFNALDTRYRVLAPASEAQVVYPEFNPFRAVQPIAVVMWPATVGFETVMLSHSIYDGTPVPKVVS